MFSLPLVYNDVTQKADPESRSLLVVLPVALAAVLPVALSIVQVVVLLEGEIAALLFAIVQALTVASAALLAVALAAVLVAVAAAVGILLLVCPHRSVVLLEVSFHMARTRVRLTFRVVPLKATFRPVKKSPSGLELF